MDRRILLVVCVLVVAALALETVVGGPKAARAKAACRDGSDNDGDGYTDWPSDPGCSNKNDRSELNPAIECDDGVDNDGDSATDMADTGCASPSDGDETDCGDGVCEGPEDYQNCPADCPIPDSCSDTDGGIIYNTAGTVSGYQGGSPYSNDDSCNGTQLTEWYCSLNTPYNTPYDCAVNQTVCTDGRCV